MHCRMKRRVGSEDESWLSWYGYFSVCKSIRRHSYGWCYLNELEWTSIV